MANIFVRGLIDMWNEEFIIEQDIFLLTVKVTASGTVTLLTITMIVVFLRLFRRLDDEYKYYTEFYSKMMPEFIVTGEKVIKSKLTIHGFL